uniref:Uncharacterized protein n=1 Tax=uncultured bacterium HB1-14 TaxID=138991 RepID=Q99IZ8_9BACT|nr:unknown [uncultured bacterium HB1-14]
MNDFFAPDVWPLILAAIIWWLLSLAPVVYSSYVVVRKNPALPRRLLFIGVVAGLSYGLLVLFLLLVSLPLSAFGVYIAPQLEAAGQLPLAGRWLVTVWRAISDWGWFVVPVVLAISSFKLVRHLAPRWHHVVAGLGPNSSFKPTPLRGSA